MATKAQLRKAGIELKRKPSGVYHVFLNTSLAGWFYKEHYEGSPRNLKQYICSWAPYDVWEYVSKFQMGFSAETFAQGKDKLLNLLGFQCKISHCRSILHCKTCPLAKR